MGVGNKVSRSMGDKWKFRGWDSVGEKGWVYGDLVHNQKVTVEGLEPRVMVGGYEVVPESVGIYTGLKDESGQDIYEKDMVEFRKVGEDFKEKYYVASVEYKNGAFNISRYSGFRIVGNTFNNKNLLKHG